MAGDRTRRRKRWRWTKRIYAAIAVFWIATIGLRLWWGWYADEQLSSVVADLRARAEPLTMAELAPDPVPPERDAWRIYRQAADEVADILAAIQRDPDEATLRDLLEYPDFRTEHRETVERILCRCTDALRDLRRARDLPVGDFGVDWSQAGFDMRIPSLGLQRENCKLLCIAAIEAARDGDTQEACEYLHDALAVGDAVNRYPALTSHLEALATDGLTCDVIEQTVAGMVAEGADRRRAIRKVIADLLDVDARAAGHVRRFRGERVIMFSIYKEVATVTKQGLAPLSRNNLMTWLWFEPGFKLDAAFTLRIYNAMVAAAKCSNLPTASEAMEPVRDIEERYLNILEDGNMWTRGSHLLSTILMPSLGRARILHYRGIANRRMAATGLAMRLYEQEHGRQVETLDELVPEYLPAVPRDPFTRDGAIRYRPDGERRRLYCLGEDGADDGGQYWNPSFDDTYARPGAPDVVFFPDGDAPRPPREEPPQPQRRPGSTPYTYFVVDTQPGTTRPASRTSSATSRPQTGSTAAPPGE